MISRLIAIPHCRRSNPRLLWRTSRMKPVAPCGDERAFHINHRHSTGYFEAPVGDVGNRSRVAAENGQFSKNSGIAQPGFRKLAQPVNSLSHTLFGSISTFPTELRVLLSFLLNYYPFSLTTRRIVQAALRRTIRSVCVVDSGKSHARVAKLDKCIESREEPLFSTRTFAPR
jgi:hypothetical protein